MHKRCILVFGFSPRQLNPVGFEISQFLKCVYRSCGSKSQYCEINTFLKNERGDGKTI
jgi:hypothetical protein